jgi:glycosyltransferase involved in cell wall biosynthesis
MDVSVIIPTHNHCDFLKETLERLGRQATPKDLEWEVVVVENNCTDSTLETVKIATAQFPVALRVMHEERQGVSWARNCGAANARGHYLAFIDDDTFPEHHWLRTTWKTFKEFRCDGVIGRIELHWRTRRPRWLTDDLLGFIGRLDYGRHALSVTTNEYPPNGGNMAFTRSAFEQTGGFNPSLGRKGGRSLLGGEEPEFFERFIRQKCVAVYQPASVVYHVIDRWRMRKSYFRGVHYHAGRARGAVFDVKDGRSIVGVPLFMFLQFGRSVSEFVRTLWRYGAHRSLRMEMNVWHSLGFIYGCAQQKSSSTPKP